MLVEAGAIDRLEAVLDSEQARERAERERLALHTRVGDLALSGARREALAVGGDLREPDARVADLLKSIQVRRISLPRVRLSLGGETLDVIFGDEVTLGRAEATLVIASPAVSRTHLSIRRSPEGPEAVDLGSRNGTLLAGARLGAPVRVGPGLELELGGEVRVQLTPWQNGGVRIAYASEVVHAPLGALELDGWKLSAADDGWLELELGAPALLDALAVHGVIQLLRGDRLRRSVDGPVLLEVVE
ncbi:MAG: FHA domain-containing protein [Myxococcales bacterium]|nr:FHA domain-containing protein [Myxococcales bacterium]